jgi:hypothetical protein
LLEKRQGLSKEVFCNPLCSHFLTDAEDVSSRTFLTFFEPTVLIQNVGDTPMLWQYRTPYSREFEEP